MNNSIRPILILASAVFACCACGSPEGLTSHTYQYYFQGAAISDVRLDAGDPAVLPDLELWMNNRRYSTGLWRTHGGWQKYTEMELKHGDIAGSRITDPPPQFSDLSSTLMGGWLGVSAGSCELVLDNISAQAEQVTELAFDSCNGSFDHQQARAALEEISGIEYTDSESSRSFVINWTVTGSFQGQPFHAEFEQRTTLIGEYTSRYESGNPVLD